MEILQEKGIDGLSMRKIAEKLDCSEAVLILILKARKKSFKY
ncbi:transcriptional regulator, TetR domain protein [Leptospira weilii serovar Topaz str. LT2116]|uniref:Transcriptional regulator, TetR domain protein n=1 Tax=Leptospira weilii serovar Topaz str. LT2116 TaxID=1088540 RepID=M3FJE0_9LEPT|nr:transcriptional regulator, TetR domain protein [Leptospira weilii serovar Topaz str. LT2116]